jgi:hypothetical protein
MYPDIELRADRGSARLSIRMGELLPANDSADLTPRGTSETHRSTGVVAAG